MARLDASVNSNAETILNRDRSGRGWPPGLRFMVAFSIPLWAVGWGIILVFHVGYGDPFFWFWALYPLLFIVAVWGGSVSRIELGPDRIVVRRPILRSWSAPLNEVLEVNAYHRPWTPLLPGRPSEYVIYVSLTNHRVWRLGYLQPEAGRRFMESLQRLQKSVRISPSG